MAFGVMNGPFLYFFVGFLLFTFITKSEQANCTPCFYDSNCSACALCSPGNNSAKCINGRCVCVPADCVPEDPVSCNGVSPPIVNTCLYLGHTCDVCECAGRVIPSCVSGVCKCPTPACCPPLCANCSA